MSHTLIYNSELHIVESKLHGDMTLGEVEVIITKIAKTAKEKDCRLIFTDFREVSRKLSILQIYELPDRTKNQPVEKVRNSGEIKHGEENLTKEKSIPR